MGFLKVSVIAMAVLIAGGFLALILAIGARMGDSEGFQPASFDLPLGAAIAETSLDGDRIAIRLRLADGGSRIILINVRTGKQEGVVELKTPP